MGLCLRKGGEGVRSCLLPPDDQMVWQLAYSAFGDEQPTLGSKRFTNEITNPEVTFNLRYPGRCYDKESDPGCGS